MYTDEFKQNEEEFISFIESQMDNPEQGTKKWLEQRGYISGSNIAILDRKNPYKNLKQHIEEVCKLSPNGYIRKIYLTWGTLCEDITQKLMERVFGVNIYVPGSIQGKIPGQTCSVDGVSLLPINKFVVWEFKNPFTRVPNGKIVSYYYPQVQCGLGSIPLNNSYGIFVNSLPRKCSKEDFLKADNSYDWKFYKSKTYNEIYHSNFMKQNDVMAFALIGVYSNNSQNEKNTSVRKERDYGKLNESSINNIKYQKDRGEYELFYSDIQIVNIDKIQPQKLLDQFYNFCENKKIIGIVPIKIFKCDVLKVEVDNNYLDDRSTDIEKVVYICKNINKIHGDYKQYFIDNLFANSSHNIDDIEYNKFKFMIENYKKIDQQLY